MKRTLLKDGEGEYKGKKSVKKSRPNDNDTKGDVIDVCMFLFIYISSRRG